MIAMQMNEHGASERYGNPGFAFTFELPAVPRDHEIVHWANRKFIVVRVDWHPFTAWPVRVIATELPT